MENESTERIINIRESLTNLAWEINALIMDLNGEGGPLSQVNDNGLCNIEWDSNLPEGLTAARCFTHGWSSAGRSQGSS